MKGLVQKVGAISVFVAVVMFTAGNVLAVESTPPGQLRKEDNASISAMKKAAAARFVHLTGATVLAVGSNSLTVSHGGESVTVNILPTTKLRRKFWGNAALSEFLVGNIVNIWGAWKNEEQTIMDGRLIRNTSIQRRNGVFVGELTGVDEDEWVLKTPARGDQKVIVGSTTKFTDRRGRTIKQGDVVVGHRVRVRGLWDPALNRISEVTIVKDYSLPPVKTEVASPSAGTE